MKALYILLLSFFLASPRACSQTTRPDLYDCEGCEAVNEHSFDDLSWETVIPDDDEPGEALTITGTVFQPDGRTPAPDVILYVYHTNARGVYPTRGDETGWARRHGYLRGWMKTNAEGKYRFRTIRPAPYPGRQSPAHIHIIVKEPDRREYWIEEIRFEGDPILAQVDQPDDPRGGPGLINLERDDRGEWHGTRAILLEP
jgi:protocatechuate 3,4-dioxygenase beta subunit